MKNLLPVASVLLLCSCAASIADRPDDPVPPSQAAAPSAAPTPSPAATPVAPAAGGVDFRDDLQLLFRMVACAGDAPLPQAVSAKVVADYCQWLGPKIEEYRGRYVTPAEKFIAGLRPAELPSTVVYPFGGGDLISALVTYPDALEYTTLSLEHAGDPRTARHLDAATLTKDLALLRKCVSGLFIYADSTSENLMQLERGGIPGQLSMFLVALAVYGQEPVSLRYFRVEPDGSLHYYDEGEIAKLEGSQAKSLNTVWVRPRSSVAFSNVEVTFRAKGDSKAPLRVHRHIAANLADDRLSKDPSVLRHLEAKGTVATMTKAASYLLWTVPFSQIRNYLLERSAFMVADSTGIPPSMAKKAGWTIETYGKFQGSFLPMGKQYNDEFRELWKSQPQRELTFRYGYPDNSHNHHLLVMRRPAK